MSCLCTAFIESNSPALPLVVREPACPACRRNALILKRGSEPVRAGRVGRCSNSSNPTATAMLHWAEPARTARTRSALAPSRSMKKPDGVEHDDDGFEHDADQSAQQREIPPG